MGIFDWAKDKFSDAKEEREWDLWSYSNKSLTMSQGIHVMKAMSIHGVLTLAIFENRADLIQGYTTCECEDRWEDGSRLDLGNGVDELFDPYVDRSVGGVKGVPSWCEVGPYTMDKWHKKVVRRFPAESEEAFAIFSQTDSVGASWLLGVVHDLNL